MFLKSIGLKEQLLDLVSDIESIIKQILETLYIDKKLLDNEFQIRISSLVEQFNEKQNEFVQLLHKVTIHQEREKYIRKLEEVVDQRDNLIQKMASELKNIENLLLEGTFQAEKKLKSVKQSEINRVFSEDVIRYAHLISKHHSVASSVYWQQGDPSRPFPTEPHFAVSNLLSSRTQSNMPPYIVPGNQASMMKTAGTMFGMAGMPQQKPATPNSRAGMFPSVIGADQATGSGSPRGRPPGIGMRMSSPSSATRTFPKILQRSGTQQSPRFNLMMTAQQQQQQASASVPTASFSSPMLAAAHQRGFIPSNMMPGMGQMQQQQLLNQMLINLPTTSTSTTTAIQQQGPPTGADVPTVEQMSSDSSSSSSSGDEAEEASPDGQ